MSSFLSAAENVAWQRQNVRHDLKEDGGRKQNSLAGIGESQFIYFCLCCIGKLFQLQ